MFNHTRSYLLLILVFLLSLPACAEAGPKTPQPAEVLQQVQSTYQRLHSLQFDFFQVTDSSGRVKEGRGFATFYRSGSTAGANTGVMRWDYEAPSPQVILNNGKELSIYTLQDKQLIITPVHNLESDITFSLFTGSKRLTDEFVASPPDPVFYINDPPANLTAVQLTPREPHPQIKRMQIWLNKEYKLHRLLMEDHFGALTELEFSNIRMNALTAKDPEKEQSLLQLDLAPGTEIIRQ